MLIVHLFLAIVWVALTGELSFLNVSFGLVLAYAILWLTAPAFGAGGYGIRVLRALRFAGYFIREVIVSSLRVAYDVITPKDHMRPGIIAVPLDAKTDVEILAVANFITVTPGSLSLELSEDRRVLYVHEMYVDDVDAVRIRIKEDLERRLLEVMR